MTVLTPSDPALVARNPNPHLSCEPVWKPGYVIGGLQELRVRT